MLINYLKVALRTLWQKKLYTTINTVGLGIAVAFSLLVYLYIHHENSFDGWHGQAKNLYRLEATDIFDFGQHAALKKTFLARVMGYDDATRNMIIHPFPLGDDLKESLPEIEAVCRNTSAGPTVLWYNKQSYKIEEEKAVYMESNFFELFDFNLLRGNAQQVLMQPSSAVISASVSRKIFGDSNPIGQTLSLDDTGNKWITVTGVVEDFPTNSSLNYDLILPLEGHPAYQQHKTDRSNNHFNYVTILKLKPGHDLGLFENKLKKFGDNYFALAEKEWQTQDPTGKTVNIELFLRPFSEAHFNTAYPWGHFTNLKSIFQLLMLALITVLAACVNYILLTLTNTFSRSQEVGIRKTLGANRRQIVWQFITVTGLVIGIAIGMGVLIMANVLPLFNVLTDAKITLTNITFGTLAVGAIGIFLVLALVAGLYPALVLSGMQPMSMLRKLTTVKINPVLSQGLVVTQYAICIVLILSSLIISRQMKFMNSLDLGFDKAQVLVVENPYDFQNPNRSALTSRLQQHAATDPAIENISFAGAKFGHGFNMNGHIINGSREWVFQVPVDYHYFDAMGLKATKGRFFRADHPTDSTRLDIPDELTIEGSSSIHAAVVVNETLYKLLQEPPLDEINPSLGARIIGVCNDYQFFNSVQKVQPIYHQIGRSYGFQYAFYKIKAGQELSRVVQNIETQWNTITARQPFVYSWMDEDVQKGFAHYERWMHIINIATLLGVLVACMGLFGLSAIYAVNRTREIGIRKVLGANVMNVFMLVNKDIIKLALIAMIVALPIAAYLLHQWLSNFYQRIDLNWTYLLLASVLALVLGVGAVSYNSIKAALMNPVNSLNDK